MKRIGAASEQAGYDVEYVVCSGDPSSLDGVYIPELRTESGLDTVKYKLYSNNVL